MKRRDFIRNAGLALSAALVPNIAFPSFLRGVLPQNSTCIMASHSDVWPPRNIGMNYDPMPLPYLINRRQSSPSI